MKNIERKRRIELSINYNPRIITDGLVLALDAGNPKNYNTSISTNWMDKIGGNNGTLVNGTYHNDGPFVGAGYVEFDGTGDYLQAPLSLNPNTSNFTIECFIYLDTAANEKFIVGALDWFWFSCSYTGGSSGVTSGKFGLSMRDSANSNWYSVSSTTSFASGRWYHVAATWDGTYQRMFVDGVLEATSVDRSAITWASKTTNVDIGGYSTNTSFTIDGFISNLRIIVGTALYTSNFTPPTGPLTAVTNTVLLTCQGNTITDASSSAHTITANGDISLTKEPFGGAGAVYFDGSGDYLEIPASSDFSFTTAPWTFECWVYHKDWTTGADPSGFQYLIYPQQPSHPSYPVAIAVRQGYYIIVDSANYGSPWYSSYNNIGSYGTAASLNTWNHVAYTRDSSGVDRIFVNGTLQFSATGKTNTSTSISSVARFGGNGSYYINGYISNLRLIKGTALYTSAFTPPSRTLEPIENTVLLTCQGQNIKDYSSSAHTITPNGNVKATIVSSAFEFDGTNDYVTIPDSDDFTLGSENFTIDAWIYPTATGSFPSFISKYAGSSTNSSFFFSLGNNNQTLEFYLHNGVSGQQAILQSGTVSLNAWNYVAAVRVGNRVATYLNGVEVASTTWTYSVYDANVSVTVGSGQYNGAYYFNGRISNTRIYKGKGLTAEEVQQNYNATKSRYQ